MPLVKMLLVGITSMGIFWVAFSYLPQELGVPLIFLLIAWLFLYAPYPFRNWRLRRRLERISRQRNKEK